MPKKYIYQDTMAKGGKPKDLPVIHTQFEEEEFEYADGGMMANGGGIKNKSRRFTEGDFAKLTEEEFYGSWNNPYYTVKKEKDNKPVAKFYPFKEILVITNDSDLLSWLKQNSYLMSFEYADGGRFRANRSSLIKYANFEDGSFVNLLRLNPLKTSGSQYKSEKKYAINIQKKGEKQKVLEFRTLEKAEEKFNDLVLNSNFGKVKELAKTQNYADGGTTKIDEFVSMSFKNQYDDWEMVVISKGFMTGKIQKDRYLVSARNIEEAKKIATELWEKEMGNSDFHIVKVMSDSLYRMKYMDKYADGGKMAHGGMTASQEDHIRDYIVRKFDTEDFYLDVEDGNLLVTATIFDEDERESFLRKLNSDLFNGMGKTGDDYVEGDLSNVDFLTEMVMKKGGKTPLPKHSKKTLAQKAAEMVGYSTWFSLDEETKAGVIADMVTEGLLPQRMAAGAKVAKGFTVTYTMLDGTKQSVEYGTKDEMDEGIASFYLDHDVADLEVKEPEAPKKESPKEEKPKKKSLFDVASAAPAKAKKDSAPQVQIDGIGDEIERYDELKAIIKNAEAEQEVIGGRIREIAKDKYLEVYEKMGRRPTTIALTDDGKEIQFTVQDRYKIVTPEKEEILKSYDNLLGIEVTYKFNNEVLDKENQNGEKIGDVINDLIMNSDDIPDDLKSRLLTVTRKASVKQGTIERLLDYTNPAEIFQVIEPITALK